MLLTCTSKGCFSYDHHKIDVDSGIVNCLECDKPIENIPNPTLSVLKTLGQVQRKNKLGMQYTCKHCREEDRPLIKMLSGGAYVALCRKCNKKMDIAQPFIQAMSEMEGYKESDTKDATIKFSASTPGTVFVES